MNVELMILPMAVSLRSSSVRAWCELGASWVDTGVDAATLPDRTFRTLSFVGWRVLAGEPVDGFAGQVGVADTPGILPVEVDQDAPHTPRLNDTM
jgi:hypothetical protein